MPETITKTNQDIWLEKGEFNWYDNNGNLIPPKDYTNNLRFRIWLRGLEETGVDDNCLARHKLIEQCRKDPLFFFNAFLWTQDPRKQPSDLPFVTYDYEDNLIKWVLTHIKEGKDCLGEKSRDMGFSWSLMGCVLYLWMFQDGFLAHIGSKKEDDVDRSGDIRSLFEKLRYLIKELPDWLRPYGFDWKKHSMFMRLINPMNNNSITGESANRDFGRAGRYSVCILDEFAFMEYADEAWTGTGDSTKCRIPISTPCGTGNKFWQLRFKSKIDVFTAHWTMHPEKAKDGYITDNPKNLVDRHTLFNTWKSGKKVSSPWYEAEKNRRLTDEKQSKVDIAQELDLDYIASGDPYFDIEALSKQIEWTESDDWINFDEKKQKVIIGSIIEVDNHLEFRPSKNGWLRLFERPKKEGQYVGALDPAEGLEHGDYSAGAFRNKQTRNLVAGIYGHFDYDELSYFGYLTARYFNNCVVCSEAGGYGSAVNKRLYDLGANVARAVDLSDGSVAEKDKLGWVNSSKTRPQALGDMEAEIREGSCELRDKDLKTECMTFINKDGKSQASEGSTDDYIWAFAIAGQLLRYRPFSKELAQSITGKKSFGDFIPKVNMGYAFRK